MKPLRNPPNQPSRLNTRTRKPRHARQFAAPESPSSTVSTLHPEAVAASYERHEWEEVESSSTYTPKRDNPMLQMLRGSREQLRRIHAEKELSKE